MTRTPRDTFLSDQALAAARDAAYDPRMVPVAITAASGQQCSWCDCPDGPDSPHNVRGYRCTGCKADARYLISTYAGPNLRYDYPSCERHHTDIIASIASLVAGSQR